MADLSACRIGVSDHAILRYLERVLGIDVWAVKNQILNLNGRVTTGELGDGKYPVGNGHHAVVKNDVVVTVI